MILLLVILEFDVQTILNADLHLDGRGGGLGGDGLGGQLWSFIANMNNTNQFDNLEKQCDEYAGYSMQHTAGNIQHATYSMQHTALLCSKQHTDCTFCTAKSLSFTKLLP